MTASYNKNLIFVLFLFLVLKLSIIQYYNVKNNKEALHYNKLLEKGPKLREIALGLVIIVLSGTELVMFCEIIVPFS